VRRDSIFYPLFKRSPSLLFELLEEVPDTATRYRFESVAVKEPSFIIDGVFLPPESEVPGVVFFLQKFKFKRMSDCMSGYSGNHCCISIVTVTTIRIGRL
jgi:predicted transposase YdaD